MKKIPVTYGAAVDVFLGEYPDLAEPEEAKAFRAGWLAAKRAERARRAEARAKVQKAFDAIQKARAKRKVRK